MNTFKCALIGKSGVGKSSFIEFIKTGTYNETYNGTFGVEVHSLVFNIVGGSQVCFNVWDIGGDVRFTNLHDGYLNQSNCCILAIDETSFDEDNINEDFYQWRDKASNYTNIGVVIQTKCDNDIDPVRDSVIPISSKDGRNINKPFEYLTRKLLQDNSIVLA